MDPNSDFYETEALDKLTSQLDRMAKDDPHRGTIFFLLSFFYELRYRRKQNSKALKQWVKATHEMERLLTTCDKSLGEPTLNLRVLLSLLPLLVQFKNTENLQFLDRVVKTITDEIVSESVARDASFQTDLIALKAML